MDPLGNERVAESGEMRVVLKQQYPCIYMYNWVQLYLNGSISDPDSLLTGSLFNQKAVYSCVIQEPIK
jgi:hypothetical protein